jgi:hypothetical protein
MSRNLLFVLLPLLATSVALADKKPAVKHATPRTAEAQKQTAALSGQTEEAQAKTKAGQAKTEETQASTDGTQGPTETQETQGVSEAAQGQTDKDAKLISVPGGKALGMSVLGNQEAPTSLVIVPWKTSGVGHSPGISPMLDDSRQPVDKEVFMRALRYYEIRSETKP